ncbi:MAG: hypothetical protein ACAH95_08425 [Fimbriimonas sp.]
MINSRLTPFTPLTPFIPQALHPQTHQSVVQVKGGNGLNLSNVRDFARVIERENAVLGIMIAQREPTAEMRLEAEKMGYAEYPGERKIPRYQILTTKGILEKGEEAILPEAWLIKDRRGVGRAVKGQTENLFSSEA